MKKYTITTTIKSLTLASVLSVSVPAFAQSESPCVRNGSGQLIGTVIGAGVGGALGNVIAGDGDKTLGTIIGVVGGGIIGNQIAKPADKCSQTLGYYDKDDRWHASGITARDASGYYNRDNDWVNGQPDGGYFTTDGHFVPANADGYYNRNDIWTSVAARQDRRGDADGYYDSKGRWINTNVSPDAGYSASATNDLRSRIDTVDTYIRSARAQGKLSRADTNRAVRELSAIRANERTMSRNRSGKISARNETTLQIRLDRLSNRLRMPKDWAGM